MRSISLGSIGLQLGQTWANKASVSGRRDHSSNICEGASTKSRLTPVPALRT